MLGNNIMVAPVYEKGQTERKVVLPKGNWEHRDGTVYKGGREITVPAPIDTLPIFIKK